jgi:hypothetical protein
VSNEQLQAVKSRILLPWQAQRGSHVWSPWGTSGWSAVEITKPSRKWAKGVRIKPNTGEQGAKAKVNLERLVRRDPALKGKDRPGFTPDEVFAHLDEHDAKEKAEQEERERQRQVAERKKLERAEAPPKPKKETAGGSFSESKWREIWIGIYMKRGMTRAEAEIEFERDSIDDW